MKKIYALLIVLAASIGSVWAQTTVEIDGINYNYDMQTQTAEVGYNFNASGNITIPATISHNGNSYDVTAVGSAAFWSCTGLTSVTFEEGSRLTTIGGDAFGGCESLTSINIPASVTTIGGGAFRRCESLTSINIPAGVTEIGAGAFSNCSNLELIEIAEGNQSYQFIEGNLLTADGTTLVACLDNWIDNSYKIPANVTTIEDFAFYACESLTSIEIPVGVTTIGNYAFSGCESLTSINIPASVTIIGRGAFSGCSGLTSVTFEEGSQLTTIWEHAFSGTGLTKITIPSNVTTIQGGAFSNCSNLELIEIAEGNRSYQFIEGNLLTADGTTLVACLNSWIDNSYKILANVTTIRDYAFAYCENLTSIDIPASVTAIGGYAFAFGGLTEITLQNETPPTLNGFGVFMDAPLTAIIVPEGSEEAYKSYIATDQWGQPNDSWSNYAHLIRSSPTSTELISGVAVVAYPNPTTDMITVTGLTVGKAINVYSLSGAQVGSYMAPAAEMTIDLSHLSSGMYYLNVEGQTIKVIKK